MWRSARVQEATMARLSNARSVQGPLLRYHGTIVVVVWCTLSCIRAPKFDYTIAGDHGMQRSIDFKPSDEAGWERGWGWGSGGAAV